MQKLNVKIKDKIISRRIKQEKEDVLPRHSFIDAGVQQAKTSSANPDSAKWDCWEREVVPFFENCSQFSCITRLSLHN